MTVLAVSKPKLSRDQQVENRIMRRAIRALLDAGYLVTVFDGEERTVKHSDKLNTIFDAMKTTDEDALIAYTRPSIENGRAILGKRVGMVAFVYGNDGYDVISDYSLSLQDVLAPVNAYADTLEHR